LIAMSQTHRVFHKFALVTGPTAYRAEQPLRWQSDGEGELRLMGDTGGAYSDLRKCTSSPEKAARYSGENVGTTWVYIPTVLIGILILIATSDIDFWGKLNALADLKEKLRSFRKRCCGTQRTDHG
jgi:hypothetical protein